jgi:hypothetical protein
MPDGRALFGVPTSGFSLIEKYNVLAFPTRFELMNETGIPCENA